MPSGIAVTGKDIDTGPYVLGVLVMGHGHSQDFLEVLVIGYGLSQDFPEVLVIGHGALKSSPYTDVLFLLQSLW